MTALHLAALSGTLACVQLLLEAGASMMVHKGLRPVLAADLMVTVYQKMLSFDGSTLVVQGRTVVGARGSQQALTAGCTPLHAAAFRGDLGIVQAMLQVRHSRPPGIEASQLGANDHPCMVFRLWCSAKFACHVPARSQLCCRRMPMGWDGGIAAQRRMDSGIGKTTAVSICAPSPAPLGSCPTTLPAR